jgi:hypothetical protein
MKFWDSSALAALLVAEAPTKDTTAIALEDPDTVVRWGTPVECASVIAGLERNNELSPSGVAAAFARLDALAASWLQVEPSDEIRRDCPAAVAGPSATRCRLAAAGCRVRRGGAPAPDDAVRHARQRPANSRRA